MKSEFQRFLDFEHHFPDVRKMINLRRFADHFVDVNKMVPAGILEMIAEARELEGKIAGIVVELLEAS